MLTLILGGARSGKSDLAQRLASRSGREVLVVATMQPLDDELRARVAAHRAARPQTWRTVEEALDPVAAIRSHARAGDFVLLDCITMWISNLLLDRVNNVEGISPAEAAVALAGSTAQIDSLLEWTASFEGEIAVVSNEVGMGVVPPYPIGRLFRDALGTANATIAARADRAYYLVAGLALDLKALGARPLDSFDEAPG